jgi:hypothetical protein
MPEIRVDPMRKISAMKAIAEALSELDGEATTRVLWWAGDRFGVSIAIGISDQKAAASTANREKEADREKENDAEFESLADLYAAATPQTDVDRALVAGYWFQFVELQEDFPSQTLNTALKDLGHGILNVTRALEGLKTQSPALAMQIKKSGNTQQARKRYKLTNAGRKAVEAMIQKNRAPGVG